MRIAGVREKTDQRLVELDSRWRFRTVRRDRALGALRRDGSGTVGEQQARPASGTRTGRTQWARWPSSAVQATSVSDRRPIMSALAIPQNRSGSCREASTDAPISVANRRIHQGRFSALTREMRLRISGPQASVVVIAASTASAVGWPPRLRRKRTNTDFAWRASSPASIASACGSRLSPTKRGANARIVRYLGEIERFVAARRSAWPPQSGRSANAPRRGRLRYAAGRRLRRRRRARYWARFRRRARPRLRPTPGCRAS